MFQELIPSRPVVESNRGEAATRETQFQPLFAAHAAALGAPASRLGSNAMPARLEAPQIELVEEEGKVRRIVVTCTCCEKIELECEY